MIQPRQTFLSKIRGNATTPQASETHPVNTFNERNDLALHILVKWSVSLIAIAQPLSKHLYRLGKNREWRNGGM